MPPQERVRPARTEPLDLAPPKLGEIPALPEVVDALRLQDGIVGRMQYSTRLGAVVRQQREVLRRLGTALSRLRREEAQCVEVLGRATRKLGLTPPDLDGAADAAGLEERAAESRLARADERHREQREAEEVYETVRSAAETRLAEIEGRYAPLAARRRELERRFAAAAARVDELRAKERELGELAEREPTDEELGGEIKLENERIVVTRRNRDEEVARREAEHGACRLELVAAERELKETSSRIQATKGPLEKAEAEMAKLRASMSAALEQLHSAEGEARAAAVAGKRRVDFANRTAAELDREIGTAVLGRLTQHELEPELEPFVAAVEKARERVRRVETRLNEQHDKLEAADEDAARSGARAIALFAALVVAALVGIAWALSALIGGG
jgi:chromosome segregation ATPase